MSISFSNGVLALLASKSARKTGKNVQESVLVTWDFDPAAFFTSTLQLIW